MPKLQIDYSKTIIYKIVCKDLKIKELYVGSSTNFTKRKCAHKSSLNNPSCKNYNIKIYEFIRNNGGWENWDMILVENYPCNNDLEKRQRERHRYEELNSTLNTLNPYHNKEDYMTTYREEHKDEIREQRKGYMDKYYENNKEDFLAQSQNYREENAEKVKEYQKQYYENTREDRLEKVKEYYENNKEKVKEYKDQYYQTNKERLNQEKKIYRDNNKEKNAECKRQWYLRKKENLKTTETTEEKKMNLLRY